MIGRGAGNGGGGGSRPENSQEKDPFEGTWSGNGTVTAHRQGTDKDKGSAVDARIDPRENVIAIRIFKSGAGYVLHDLGSGQQMKSTNAGGNRIGFRGRVANPRGQTIDVTLDYQVAGNRLTGTQRAEGDDGSLIVMSVSCSKQ